MNDFLTTYGLWLVIALLVLIALVYLLSRKGNGDVVDTPVLTEEVTPVQTFTAPSVAATPRPPVIDPVPVVDVLAPAAPIPITPIASTSPAGSDNLMRMKGVGPKLAAMLNDLGVTSFAQIAAWTDSDLAAVDARLGNFKGRPVRDQWIDQAKYLASGDTAGFEAKYGKL
jgi:predicted flap endonuclease-1-like 5' DNA nuclease